MNPLILTNSLAVCAVVLVGAGRVPAQSGDAVDAGVPVPTLPLPDWREVPAVNLFPPVQRGSGNGNGGLPGMAPLPGDVAAAGWDDPSDAPAPPEIGGFHDPAELQRYIDSLPELEEVSDFSPAVGGAATGAVANETGTAQLRWFRNPREARRVAEEEGKYFLLAFVGLKWQSLSNTLNDDVFNTVPFAEFGSENLVAAYLDFAQNSDENHPVYERFKEFCGVKGFPAVALFAPDGVLLETYNGYNSKAGPDAYFLRLKDRLTSDRFRLDQADKRRQNLVASGYRIWHNTEGKKVFARVRSVRGGRVYFEHEDGRRTAAPISALAFVDQEIARRTAGTQNSGSR